MGEIININLINELKTIINQVQDSVSPKLSWTHYRVLIRVENKEAREWYIKEAIENRVFSIVNTLYSQLNLSYEKLQKELS